MSNELYYRGSEEYAVAVKNQLRRMELQGIHDTKKSHIPFKIWNMESEPTSEKALTQL